jgi:allantoate deiminase
MEDYLERALHIQQRINELSTQYPKTWLYGSKAFIEKSNTIASLMKEAGLETRIDNIGNIRGILKSKSLNAKTFVIGSHFDNGVGVEKYDGILGVLAGINVVEHLQSQQIEIPFNIEVIAFAEEEGLRFNFTYLGSKVVAGTFEKKLLELKDNNGISLSEVLKSMHLNPKKLEEDAIPADDFWGYFEIHVEQGSDLADSGIPFGIGSSIFGQKRIEIIFSGKDGHAGNVPMDRRKDALAAAAKFITTVEKYAKRAKRNIVATVGKIHIPDAAGNKIAGSVTCTLDLRSNDEKSLSEAYEIVNNECEKICGKRNIYFEWNLIQETDPAICNKKLRRLLANSITGKNIQFLPMESGAGYDAAIISKVAPFVMLFLMSLKDGNNNLPEDQGKNNIATALEISDHFMKQLISSAEKSFRKKEKEK